MERLLSSLCSCSGRSLIGLTLTATCLQLSCCLLVSGSAADDYSGTMSRIQYVAYINLSYIDGTTGEWRTERERGFYGSESRLEDEWGVVVHVRAIDNRTDGCKPPVNAPSDRWIALIRRGACKFHQKIHNAGIISNASAVVIYNNEEDKNLVTMKHKGSTVMLYKKTTNFYSLIKCANILWLIFAFTEVEVSSNAIRTYGSALTLFALTYVQIRARVPYWNGEKT